MSSVMFSLLIASPGFGSKNCCMYRNMYSYVLCSLYAIMDHVGEHFCSCFLLPVGCNRVFRYPYFC